VRAVQLVQPGAPLVAREVAAPTPGAGEVVVTVEAAGVCRSDLHYRAGFPTAGPLPLTLGHEVAGSVAAVGAGVSPNRVGERVALHYLVTCGACGYCAAGATQFCPTGEMLGKDRAGGYAEAIVVPERNAHPVPGGVPVEHAAVMMCSTVTALHALRKGAVGAGETVAVLGLGGLGMAAIQLAALRGAGTVLGVDLDPAKRATAAALGAVPVAGGPGLAARLREAGGGPVDVVLDLVGSVPLLREGLAATGPLGRVVAVGLTADELPVAPYAELIVGERTLVGCSDHLPEDVPEVLGYAADGRLRLDDIVTRRIALDAEAVNGALDDLAEFTGPVRTVIVPGTGAG
jgi:propanol-preferring alcohol dehydrogenase